MGTNGCGFDAIIVGAGPAGSSAGFHLARSGEIIPRLSQARRLRPFIFSARFREAVVHRMLKDEANLARMIDAIAGKIEYWQALQSAAADLGSISSLGSRVFGLFAR